MQQPDAALPDIPTLMRSVEQHQHEAEKLQSQYFYRCTIRKSDTDSQGKVKKSETYVQEVSFVDGVPVERMVSKNGKLLSDREKAKEEDHVAKEVRDEKKRREKGEDEITLSRILELGKFTKPQHVQWNGRSTIMVDYAGDPTVKTHNVTEAGMKNLVGRVWVDEETQNLVRTEGHFTNDVKVGAGLLLNVHKGLHFTFENTYVNQEVWLPLRMDVEGDIRILLLEHIQGNRHLEFSDYRKFTSTVKILPDAKELPPQP